MGGAGRRVRDAIMNLSGRPGAWWQRFTLPVVAIACLLVMALNWLPSAWGRAPDLAAFTVVAAGLVVLAIAGWRSTGRALRERDALERRIERLEAEKADLEVFVHAATHDLHEPLRKIQAFGERLREQLGLMADPAALQSLGRMTGAADRLRALLDALHKHARVRDTYTRIERVDLDAVIAGILEARSGDIRTAGAEVETGGLGDVEADAGQMRTLLENIIDNALKYRRLDANVNIRIAGRDDADGDGGRVVIEITDNGIGFDPRHAERIFGLFERLHSRDAYEGAGVGLATCRKIAERHGGSLSARGEPGAGACFTLILPRRQASLSSEPAATG
jgi:signal transduction histidine kinase